MLAALGGATRGEAAPTAPVANSASFTDSTGEDALGPDVTTVTVSNDDKGNLSFVVNIPNRATLTADMFILMFVDADANPASGDTALLGADYAIELDGPLSGPAAIGLFRWNGTDFVGTGVPQTTLIFSYANGATIKINASELGATKKFNFAVIAVSGVALSPTGDIDLTNAHLDFAPDPGHGTYAYEVKLTPPSLLARGAGTRPTSPKAGKAFSAFVSVARSDTGVAITTGTVSCKASVAGKPLRASPGLASGRASCAMTVPKTAKGKTIRVTITVVSEGLKVSRTFSARVG